MAAGGLTQAEAAQPPQQPMEGAAGASIGSNRSWINRVLETLAIVVGPLLVPACVLAVIRLGGVGLRSVFTVPDVSFGVVAVAFAALARAMVSKNDGWKIVSFVGLVIIVFETAIGSTMDNVVDTEKLTVAIVRCGATCDLTRIRQLASIVDATSPNSLQWAIVLILGVFLCFVTIFTIWVEK